MSEHTPGPWELWTSCSWRRFCGEGGREVCVPVIQRGDNHPDLFFPNGGESGPDAHLIATAPDLLKLAEHVASLNPDAGEIGPGMLRQIIEEAEAALAKANGNENPNGE